MAIRESPRAVGILYVLTFLQVSCIGFFAFWCSQIRGRVPQCTQDTNRAVTDCRRARLNTFEKTCDGHWRIAPWNVSLSCFDPWVESCWKDAGYECGKIDPCGWVTIASSVIFFSAGYFLPRRKFCWKVVETSIAPADRLDPASVITLGGCSVAKLFSTNRLLKYTVDLPTGIEKGMHVRWPADLGNPQNAADSKLDGLFIQVTIPPRTGDSFSILYDRETRFSLAHFVFWSNQVFGAATTNETGETELLWPTPSNGTPSNHGTPRNHGG